MLEIPLTRSEQAQYMFRGQFMGLAMRNSLISLITRKSLRMSGKARTRFSQGHLTTLVSSDASAYNSKSPEMFTIFDTFAIQVSSIGLLLFSIHAGSIRSKSFLVAVSSSEVSGIQLLLESLSCFSIVCWRLWHLYGI